MANVALVARKLPEDVCGVETTSFVCWGWGWALEVEMDFPLRPVTLGGLSWGCLHLLIGFFDSPPHLRLHFGV